jgi:hypothetical protein
MHDLLELILEAGNGKLQSVGRHFFAVGRDPPNLKLVIFTLSILWIAEFCEMLTIDPDR